ncbi:DUF6082 family protein [Svornostia abyssi]|uniref:DUF6082 family protein n=1 Tax=Svornostia abyssi TaxID=2898438 RepID=A0ABY5PAB0_9ACTN|nr:DUF6082 family protein [Parviterribacteraceae bacterium J379]
MQSPRAKFFTAAVVSVVGIVLLATAWASARFAASLFPSDTRDLDRLAAAGEAFGAASAVLSALAVIGVLLTLQQQRRQNVLYQEEFRATKASLRTNSEVAVRQLHAGLLALALADQDLLSVWPTTVDEPPRRTKQSLYSNLVVSHFQTMYVLGYVDTPTMYANLLELFASDIVREFWTEVSSVRADLEPSADPLIASFIALCDRAAAVYTE